MKHWLLPIVSISAVIGCARDELAKPSSPNDYLATVRSARSVIPLAIQMEELFPEADHFITHFGFGQSPRIWNTVVYFGGKYSLSMQVDVGIDYARSRVTRIVGEPKFVLTEVKRITLLADGRTDADMRSDHERHFGPAEWKAIYESKGDLSELGLKNGGLPVEHFDEYVSSWRRPRVPVVSLLKE